MAIGNNNFYHWLAITSGKQLRRFHRDNDKCGNARLEIGNGDHVCAIDVSTRIRLQQIENALDAEVF